MKPTPLYRHFIFNPGRLTDAEIKTIFVVRDDVLGAILDDIDAAGRFPQHHLIIGQRGMGKTTLLRRLEAALHEAPLMDRFVPLGFPEEHFAIDRLSRFWLNCLDALADTIEREGHSRDILADVDQAVRAISGEKNEENRRQLAEQELIRLSGRLRRRAVLLVDNVDLLLSRLTPHEQDSLRGLIMRPGAPILAGTCITPPLTTQDYEAPFYDHFRTYYLNRLSLEQMKRLLDHLAATSGLAEVRQRIPQEGPRLQTLNTLTGGNPRTTAILFHIFSKGFSDEAYQDLEALLDWITPLYKARFEELSNQAQVIVSALALHWEPATSAELGELTRLNNNQVSPQLDRLKKAGLVEETIVDLDDRTGPLPEGAAPQTRTGYQLAERCFNVWFLMRQATRRDRQSLVFLTRFLECMHREPEKPAMARRLLDTRRSSRERRVFGLAFEPALQDQGLRDELRDQDANSSEAERLLSRVTPEEHDKYPDSLALHRALFAAYGENWGLAASHLKSALESIRSRAGFPPDTRVDWMYASAILLHLGFGQRLLEWLVAEGYQQVLRPWFEALRAQTRGDRKYLRNIPAEMQEIAGLIYDHVERLRVVLPETTRRWPSRAERKTTSKSRRQPARAKAQGT